LIEDAVSVSFLELPNYFQELLPAEVVSSLSSLLEEFFLCDSLCCNTGVVCAWNEERFVSVHAFVSDEGVLYRHGESMSDVQIASHIGWRQANSELLGVGGLVVGMEELAT
jgi:hypothetical protein